MEYRGRCVLFRFWAFWNILTGIVVSAILIFRVAFSLISGIVLIVLIFGMGLLNIILGILLWRILALVIFAFHIGFLGVLIFWVGLLSITSFSILL